MTKQEAIEILDWIPTKGDEVEAIEMAIEALSNTPNTFNTLEALDITDKQINMAIGAIIHMITNGYYSEDMEDALNSAIKVLAEAERGEGMMFFTERKELADKAEQWMEENHVAKTPLSVISYLEAMGWLKTSAQKEKSTTAEKSQLAEEKSTRKLIYLDDAIDVAKQHWYKPDIEGALEALPSVQERKKGEWIETEFLKLKECSCCHSRWGMYDVENFDFCPNCGADMRTE